MGCEPIVSGPFHARIPLGMIHADERTGLRFWLTFPLRSHDDFLTDSMRRPVSVAIVFFAFALPAVRVPPVIDGVIGPNEWAGARRERLTHGSEVLLLRLGQQLYVGVVGSARGYPSLCIGDFEQTEILHASAALGSAVYARAGQRWLRRDAFEWRLRAASPPAIERELFFRQYGWLSTASSTEASAREFHIALRRHRRFLGVTFLSTDTMQSEYWPSTMRDECSNLELLRGDAPKTLRFEPSSWHERDRG